MDSQSEESRMKLQGPRPGPLMVNKSSRKMMKKKHVAAGQKQCSSPVVIYLRSPKVFHVKPEEFMGLVKQLTGNPNNPPPSTSSFRSSETLHRPESEKNAGDEISQSEHFKWTSTVGPTHALSTDFHTLMHFVDFV